MQFVYGHDRTRITQKFWMACHTDHPFRLSSMISAYLFHEQDFNDTLLAQRTIYFYLFYFLLHQLKPEAEDLEKIIIGFGILNHSSLPDSVHPLPEDHL